MTIDDEVLKALEHELPSDSLITARDSLEAFRRDMAETVTPGMPLIAVQPSTVEEVATVLRIADRHRVPVVPRGAGTGLSGGASAIEGCIVVSMQRMNAILEIDTADWVAVVQPGVTNVDITRAVAAHGLAYAPDPASFEISSIGGNLATNAGGLRCVRYGVTRDSTLGLQVALPGGAILRAGGRVVKNVAGYDLVSLFVGSEGTLGIITEATLRLRPRPPAQATALATFATLDAAGQAATAIVGVANPTVLELMDSTTTRAIEGWRKVGLDENAAATLIVQCDAEPTSRPEVVASRCEEAGALTVFWSSDAAESELLMGIRRLAFPALERLGATILDDVSVPVGRVSALLKRIGQLPSVQGVTIATFGHAGDGNLHPTLIYPRGDTAARQHAIDLAAAISALAVELGGSVTGEHGVGILKRDWYRVGADPTALQVMEQIKNALDPNQIMNPGKGW